MALVPAIFAGRWQLRGYHPADSKSAIAHLRSCARKGRFCRSPNRHSGGSILQRFKHHLEHRYRTAMMRNLFDFRSRRQPCVKALWRICLVSAVQLAHCATLRSSFRFSIKRRSVFSRSHSHVPPPLASATVTTNLEDKQWHEQYKFTWAAASILALVVAFSGCRKKEGTRSVTNSSLT